MNAFHLRQTQLALETSPVVLGLSQKKFNSVDFHCLCCDLVSYFCPSISSSLLLSSAYQLLLPTNYRCFFLFLQFKLMLSHDGSGKGAALVAAVADRLLQKKRQLAKDGTSVQVLVQHVIVYSLCYNILNLNLHRSLQVFSYQTANGSYFNIRLIKYIVTSSSFG